jgi:putative transposase
MLLKEQHYKDCEEAIRKVADRHGIVIKEIGVMPDHVHVVVTAPPEMSTSKIIGLLKGGSSYELFRMHEKFRLRYPQGHFWGRGYFYRTVSEVDEETVREYVREDNSQKQRRLS